ncbi:MAG: hypothetical protein LBP22_04350 [Deltaproteobacteria bacterium]|jgi:ABC-type uncharacterized transport system auxiliary subunit|nr:hypothetical protein [Deltaproteobacteria bacterium]
MTKSARTLITSPVIISALFLISCGLAKPYPVINTYDIDPPGLGPPVFSQIRPYVLRVSQFNTAAAYETSKFIYRTREGRLVEDFYNELMAGPSRLLADSLATYLDRTNPYCQVVRAQGEKKADFVLEGYVAELLGDFSQNPPQARITVAVTLNDVRRNQVKIVLARTYQAQVTFNSETAAPAPELAQAAAQAWLQILTGLERDIDEYFRGQKKR